MREDKSDTQKRQSCYAKGGFHIIIIDVVLIIMQVQVWAVMGTPVSAMV